MKIRRFKSLAVAERAQLKVIARHGLSACRLVCCDEEIWLELNMEHIQWRLRAAKIQVF